MANNNAMDATSLVQHMNEEGVVDLTSYAAAAAQAEGNKKRKRNNNTADEKLTSAPQISELPTDANLLQAVYSAFHLLHIKAPLESMTDDQLTWKSLQSLFASLDQQDQDSWCIEKDDNNAKKSSTPHEFLQPKVTQDRGYCSFLVQKPNQEEQQQQHKFPLAQLSSDWSQGDCTWFFFGRNVAGSSVEGRPEHTDAVSHDGTWHYQLSGTKTWFLRPTVELLERDGGVDIDANQVLEVNCREGDVLIVNTRLWWHRTEIPKQHVPSVSYARDFYFSKTKRDETTMSNVDGMYAATDIEAGTIVFREEDVPDCELHRSKDNPNCEVTMLEDEDVYAVVSIRAIKAGEFFCVAESDDEEEDEENEDWDEVEEEEEEEEEEDEN
jgi:hypothetical protein